jgi:hypothetical protein
LQDSIDKQTKLEQRLTNLSLKTELEKDEDEEQVINDDDDDDEDTNFNEIVSQIVKDNESNYHKKNNSPLKVVIPNLVISESK